MGNSLLINRLESKINSSSASSENMAPKTGALSLKICPAELANSAGKGGITI